MTTPRDHGNLDEHVRFATELGKWLERAGVADGAARTDLSVGMADILYAATHAAAELEELLKLNPTTPEGAEAAFERICTLNAYFVTEILGHAQDLAARWEQLEAPMSERIPDDDE